MSEKTDPTRDVYISYSPQDKKWADATCAVLERRRVRCWIAPRDIAPGEELGAAIMNGINQSRIMVLIFSGHANTSGQVHREVERAIGRGMPILPVRIEDVPFEGAIEYAVGNTHWLDAFTTPVERHLELIARSVQKLLGHDVEPAPGPEPGDPEGPRPGSPLGGRPWWAWAAVAAGVLAIAPVGAWLGGGFKGKAPVAMAGPEGTPAPSAPIPVASRAASSPPPAASKAKTAEFVPLFNGKDLSGWKVAANPNQTWKVPSGGILEGSGGGGTFISTDRNDFANFHLRFETKLVEGKNPNSGMIRFRDTEINRENHDIAGYSAYIPGTGPSEANPGSLGFSMGSANTVLVKADPVVPIAPGEWFTQEVIAEGDVITVIVQGKEVVKSRILRRGLTSGSISLLCRFGSKVAFRKVEIKELGETSAGHPIAKGIDPGASSDWSRVARIARGDWKIEGDTLFQSAIDPDALIFFGDPTWADYTFSAEVKIVKSTDHVGLVFRNGGEQVNGRYAFHGGLRGIYGGAIFSTAKGNIPARRTGNTILTAGKWHQMKIRVQGDKLTASLDDSVVMAATDSFKSRGAVGFSTTKSTCRFRNIKVTAPNGNVLWEGLPEILTADSFGIRP